MVVIIVPHYTEEKTQKVRAISPRSSLMGTQESLIINLSLYSPPCYHSKSFTMCLRSIKTEFSMSRGHNINVGNFPDFPGSMLI